MFSGIMFLFNVWKLGWPKLLLAADLDVAGCDSGWVDADGISRYMQGMQLCVECIVSQLNLSAVHVEAPLVFEV